MIIHGDCLEELKKLEDNSIDAICCDPPYGLSFMGKKWDYDVPSIEVWQECLRVLKPGGYLLAFAGTRTQHRMAGRYEQAGYIMLRRNVAGKYQHKFEHVYLWEKHNGKIPSGYEIHHINGIKNDNRLGNLQCVSISAHRAFTHSGKKRGQYTRKTGKIS